MQRLGVVPAALVEEAAEAAAERRVLIERVLVVDRAEQALVRDVEERHAWRLVDAAALRLDDAVLDLVAHAEAVAAADRVRLEHAADRRGEPKRLPPIATGTPRSKTTFTRSALDLHVALPRGDAHDRLDDRDAAIEALEVLRLVRRAEHVAVGAVGLLAPSSSRGGRPSRGTRDISVRPPSSPTNCGVEPGLVDAHLGLRRAGRSDRSAGCRCPCACCRRRRCRRRPRVIARAMAVPVTARPSGVVLKYLRAGRREVERAALEGDDALARDGLAAVEQPRADGAVPERLLRDVVDVLLVGLREVGRVRVDDEALARQPGDGAARVEATGKRDGDGLTLLGERSEDASHGVGSLLSTSRGSLRETMLRARHARPSRTGAHPRERADSVLRARAPRSARRSRARWRRCGASAPTCPTWSAGRSRTRARRTRSALRTTTSSSSRRCHDGGAAVTERAIAAALAAAPAWAAMPFEERARIFLRAADLLAGPWRPIINAATMLGQSKTAYQAEIDAACELIDFLALQRRLRVAPRRAPADLAAGVLELARAPSARGLRARDHAVQLHRHRRQPAHVARADGQRRRVEARREPEPRRVPHDAPLRGRGPPARRHQRRLRRRRDDRGHVPRAIATSPGVHFTGSTKVFQSIWRTVGENIASYKTYPRLVGETGGKDFVFAHPSAEVEALAVALVRGAFEFQGQKCSAASRAYVPRSIWPKVRDLCAAHIAKITMGDVDRLPELHGRRHQRARVDAPRRAGTSASKADSGVKLIADSRLVAREGLVLRPDARGGVRPARTPSSPRSSSARCSRCTSTTTASRTPSTTRSRSSIATSPYALTGVRLRARSRGRRAGREAAPPGGRQHVHQRQAHRRRRRPAALRRRSRLRHERQGRQRVQPPSLGVAARREGDVRSAARASATRSWAPSSEHDERALRALALGWRARRGTRRSLARDRGTPAAASRRSSTRTSRRRHRRRARRIVHVVGHALDPHEGLVADPLDELLRLRRRGAGDRRRSRAHGAGTPRSSRRRSACSRPAARRDPSPILALGGARKP